MLRLASVALVLGLVLGVPVAVALIHRWRQTPMISRRAMAMDETIQLHARENYDLLQRFVRFTDQQLTEDRMVGSTLAFLSEERREQAQELVNEFYRRQKG